MVDYAGLFPPAQLPLDEAVREYAAHLGDAEAWMLGRFIIPAQRLGELEPHLGTFPETLHIAALGKGGRSEDEYLKNLDADLAAIETFRAAHTDTGAVESFEARLPPLPGAAMAPVKGLSVMVGRAAIVASRKSAIPPGKRRVSYCGVLSSPRR